MASRFLIACFLLYFTCVGTVTAQFNTSLQDVRQRLERFTVQPVDSLFVAENAAYKEALMQGDKKKQALSLQHMGQICYGMGLVAQSLNYHLQAEELLKTVGQNNMRASNLNDLGLLLLLNNQGKEAKQSYFEAIKIYTNNNDQKGLAYTYGNLGHLYEKSSDYDSAFFFQAKAMKSLELIKDLDGIALIHENLGSIYEDKEQYDIAYLHFSKALERFKVNGNASMLIDAYNNMGDILRKTGRYQEALVYTQKAVQLSNRTKAYSRLSSAYRDLGKTYNFLNKTDSTFYYLELSRQMYINIYNEDSKNQAALLNVLYDINQKDAQIADMARQKRTAAVLYFASAIVAVLLIILSFVFIKNQRQRIINERNIREKESALLSAKQQLMEVELKNKKLQEEQLKKEVESKAREISLHTLQAIEKNQLLEEMKKALSEIIRNDSRSYKRELRQLLNKINQSFHKEVHWDDFRRIFEEINQDFFHQLQRINPDLSATDLRLVSLIKLNMNTPDIAALLGISADSLRVSRYRLRKKLGLEQGKSLTAFLQSI
ncbi:MAG TPA: tetratricopeptide repeat protein [Pseudosphingobacterium sp.]|nr:tetratricopeptide repeat protein [Pseudosphingobacterium sp.]